MLYPAALIVYLVYFLVWTQFEGNITAVSILGGGAAFLIGWTVWRRMRSTSLARTRLRATIILALVGMICGVLTPLLILVGMALKMGLHNHGPEYSLAAVAGVVNAFMLTMAAGTLFGAGMGALQTLPPVEDPA